MAVSWNQPALPVPVAGSVPDHPAGAANTAAGAITPAATVNAVASIRTRNLFLLRPERGPMLHESAR